MLVKMGNVWEHFILSARKRRVEPHAVREQPSMDMAACNRAELKMFGISSARTGVHVLRRTVYMDNDGLARQGKPSLSHHKDIHQSCFGMESVGIIISVPLDRALTLAQAVCISFRYS